MRLHAFCLIAIFAAGTAAAQNMPATQLFSTPLLINPAMTGLMPTDIRFTENFIAVRSSDPIGYAQLRTSLDMAILKGALPAGDAMGVGVLYSNSFYNFGSAISTTGVSAAYHKAIDKNKRHHISLGAQAMLNRSFYYKSYSNLDEKTHISNTALNTGLQYSGVLSDKVAIYGGYALLVSRGADPLGMVNRPAINLINAGGSFKLSSRVQLFANTCYAVSNTATELTLGSYARILLNTPDEKTKKRDLALYLGGWFSSYNMASPYIGLQAGSSRIGFSYNTYLPDAPGTNTWELSFIFTTNRRKHTTTPTTVTTDAATPPLAPPARWQCPTIF